MPQTTEVNREFIVGEEYRMVDPSPTNGLRFDFKGMTFVVTGVVKRIDGPWYVEGKVTVPGVEASLREGIQWRLTPENYIHIPKEVECSFCGKEVKPDILGLCPECTWDLNKNKEGA